MTIELREKFLSVWPLFVMIHNHFFPNSHILQYLKLNEDVEMKEFQVCIGYFIINERVCIFKAVLFNFTSNVIH